MRAEEKGERERGGENRLTVNIRNLSLLLSEKMQIFIQSTLSRGKEKAHSLIKYGSHTFFKILYVVLLSLLQLFNF